MATVLPKMMPKSKLIDLLKKGMECVLDRVAAALRDAAARFQNIRESMRFDNGPGTDPQESFDRQKINLQEFWRRPC